MNDRPRRLILLLMGLGLSLLPQSKGRVVSPAGDDAAFLPSGTQCRGQVVVRLRGDLVTPGVYTISSPAHLESVIKMAMHVSVDNVGNERLPMSTVYSGNVLTLTARNGKIVEIKSKTMNVLEKMLLGIPLDPNSMDARDWECLPGIGPATANTIVYDRQIYGDFSSYEDLQRVPGIGQGKLKKMRRYFNIDIRH